MIRGKLIKRVWINEGDFILVGLREYQDDKCDCLLKYSAEEARRLKGYGELPDDTNVGDYGTQPNADEANDCGFVFDFETI